MPCVRKNETRPLSLTLYKNQCQIDQNLYIKPQTEIAGGENRVRTAACSNKDLINRTLITQEISVKWKCREKKKLLYGKRKLSKEAAYRMGQNPRPATHPTDD